MAEVVLGIVIALGVLVALVLAFVEYQYRQQPGNVLEVVAGDWHLDEVQPGHYRVTGLPQLENRTRRFEVMIPECRAEATVLSGDSLDGVSVTTTVTPQHPGIPARADNYWFGYITKAGHSTTAAITVDIKGADLSPLKTVWVKLHYVTYGPQGRIPKTRHIIVPLKFPDPKAERPWRQATVAEVLPVPTHLLTHLDTPVDIVKRYVQPHAQPGDIVTIGETPVAIMQGRWRHPADIQPGFVARRVCRYFLPTSSLATACGMQTLVDIVGPWRVVYAFIGGAIAKKLLNKPGMFYSLAGEQARLIDDVTGTLPPYDQFIILGPHDPQQVVNQIRQETGLEAAIVDVNDLKAVKVLAATAATDQALLSQALMDNPAGNADEQTPVVLVRPRNP